MSTKTSFKRIALVAASALAIAGFSAVPAHAAISLPLWIDTATTVGGVAVTADTATVTRTLDTQLNAAAVKTITAPAGSAIIFTVKTAGTFVTTNIIDMSINGSIVQSDTTLGTAATAVTATRNLPSPSVKTTYNYVLTVYATAGTDRSASTLTSAIPVAITVTPLDGFSGPLSTALKGDGNAGGAATTATDALAVDGTATASAVNTGFITVSLFDAAGVAMANAGGDLTLNAAITGPGYLSYTTANASVAGQCSATPTFGAALGRSIATTTADAVGTIYICADGNSGTSTITVSVTDENGVTAQVGSVKTVTFFGAATTLSVHAANYTIGKSGGAVTGATTASSTTTPAIVIKQVDKLGVVASTATPTVVSSDVTVVASGSCVADLADATYGYGATGYYDCSFTTASSAKSGDKATLTFRIVDPADATKFLTTTQAVTVGGSVATETLSFDAASYAAGAPMVITRTAVDSSGNPVFDGASVPAVSFTKAVGGTAPAASTNGANKGGYIGGKKVTSATAPTVFAPAVSGEFSAYMTSGNTAATTLTAVSSVEGDQSSSLALDAANAATDAANNAYDEAQNATQAASDALAAVTELATQVTSLIASVKKLTAAVAKLSKKK